jgi:hypothetical protein
MKIFYSENEGKGKWESPNEYGWVIYNIIYEAESEQMEPRDR